MLNPYAIIGALVLLIAVAFGGTNTGRKLERATWQAKEIATAAAAQKELTAAHDKYVQLQQSNESAARKATADHEQAINDLTKQYDAARAAIRAAGGLRISRTVCADPHAAATEGASAGRLDESTAATVALPERITDDLLLLTKRADEVSERLRALQNWVRSNGQY